MGRYNDAEKEAFGDKPRQSTHEFFTEQLRRKFMKLPYEQKELIRYAKTLGLEWKGEDTNKKHKHLGDKSHFEHLIGEWKLMKELGCEEYRKRALAALDGFTKRHVVGDGRAR